MKKPLLLWICDVPDWAYDNRMHRIMSVLTEYEHKVVYIATSKNEEIHKLSGEADVVFCSYLKWIKLLNTLNNCVVCMSGVRQLVKHG